MLVCLNQYGLRHPESGFPRFTGPEVGCSSVSSRRRAEGYNSFDIMIFLLDTNNLNCSLSYDFSPLITAYISIGYILNHECHYYRGQRAFESRQPTLSIFDQSSPLMVHEICSGLQHC